jgi:hypothetical protein
MNNRPIMGCSSETLSHPINMNINMNSIKKYNSALQESTSTAINTQAGSIELMIF